MKSVAGAAEYGGRAAPAQDAESGGLSAYAPAEVARRVASAGVAKARMATLPLVMLGFLAGAFIGLGAMLSALVQADASLGLAARQLLGGLVFSLGLVLVTVAGAELFTGNNLLVMARADGLITTRELLRNWGLVALANFAGAAGLAVVVFASGHAGMGEGAVGRAVLRIALAKQQLPPGEAFLRGVLCNVLVCMAVWMAMAGRSVADRMAAVVFPITAFVAAGFEHSIANMYLLPQAMLLQLASGLPANGPVLTWGGIAANLAAVLAGNVIGGSVLVGLAYHVIYRRPREA